MQGRLAENGRIRTASHGQSSCEPSWLPTHRVTALKGGAETAIEHPRRELSLKSPQDNRRDGRPDVGAA